MIKKYLKVISTILILALVVYLFRKMNIFEVYALFKRVDPLYFILAFLLYFISVLIFTLRNVYFLRQIVRPNFLFLLNTTFAGFFVNIITPGSQIGGEPVRAYFIGKRYNKSKSKILGALFADRVIHGCVSLFFGVFSVLFLIKFIDIPSEFKIVLQTFLFFVSLFIVLGIFLKIKKINFDLKVLFRKFRLLRWMNPFRKNKKLLEKILKIMRHFTKSFAKTITHKKTLFAGITLSLIYWVIIYSIPYFLFLAFGISVSFFFIIIATSLGSIIGEFSPTPGGIGITEGFMIFLYSMMGVSLPLAITISLLTRFITYFYDLLVGGLNLIYLKDGSK